MIAYAPIDEIIKRPPQPLPQFKKTQLPVDDPDVESECYYLTVVFILMVIVLLASDILKNK